VLIYRNGCSSRVHRFRAAAGWNRWKARKCANENARCIAVECDGSDRLSQRRQRALASLRSKAPKPG
jgi:hypothetical protein